MIIDVIPIKRLPRGIGDTFSYNLDPSIETEIQVGQLVGIDFRNKIVQGLVKTLKDGDFEPSLKTVSKILDPNPLITPEQMRLALWIANFYFTSLGTATKLVTPTIPKRTKSEILEPKEKQNTPSPSPKLLWGYSDENETSLEKHIQNTLKSGRQILWLFPEHYRAKALFEAREEAHLWQNHSSKNKALAQWLSIKSGNTSLLVGTRSALFAPFANLGLIIVEDEAHPLYKSEITPRYHSREVAQELARQHGALLLLRTSAPSLESYYQFSPDPPSKKYNITIIDIKDERMRENYSPLSESLQTEIQNTLDSDGATFLYHNRRGHATSATCKECGYTFMCPDCHLPYTYHNNGRLRCHHCRRKADLEPFCPSCGNDDIKLMGKGSQRLETEVKKLYPKATVIRIDSDSADVSSQKADIIIGTEFALSEHRVAWEKIKCIGIINADQGLYRPDYRASERVYQNLARLIFTKDVPKIILQTYNPENQPIKALLKDPAEFYNHELEIRKALSYPPFSDVIKLIYRNNDEKKTVGEAMHIYHRLRKHLIKEAPISYPIDILKPFPAFDRMERGKYKFHLIVRIAHGADEEIYEKIRQLVPPDWVFDRDPETLL